MLSTTSTIKSRE